MYSAACRKRGQRAVFSYLQSHLETQKSSQRWRCLPETHILSKSSLLVNVFRKTKKCGSERGKEIIFFLGDRNETWAWQICIILRINWMFFFGIMLSQRESKTWEHIFSLCSPPGAIRASVSQAFSGKYHGLSPR